MKLTHLILLLTAGAVAAAAQIPAKPASPAAPKARPAVSASKTAGATKPAGASVSAEKLPPGVPAVAGLKKVAFSLRYQEIKIGTGADATPNKLYKVHYTGWLAADGHKFDSSLDHRSPELDKDGKPVMDADGKPKLAEGQPIAFPQGFGRVIPGWDQGFNGMKIGGKRRLLIPWQLAYGAAGRPGPDAAHPGIPPKADLIFDVELVDITDMPTQQSRPGMPPTGASSPMHMQLRPSTAAPAGATAPPASSGTPAPPTAPAPAPAAPAIPPSAK